MEPLPVVGPVVDEHVIPDTPAITQVPAPVGIVAPFGGLTVAVNVKEEPSETVVKLGTTVIVAIPRLTKVFDDEARVATAE